jgi:hypothetical protein
MRKNEQKGKRGAGRAYIRGGEKQVTVQKGEDCTGLTNHSGGRAGIKDGRLCRGDR